MSQCIMMGNSSSFLYSIDYTSSVANTFKNYYIEIDPSKTYQMWIFLHGKDKQVHTEDGFAGSAITGSTTYGTASYRKYKIENGQLSQNVEIDLETGGIVDAFYPTVEGNILKPFPIVSVGGQYGQSWLVDVILILTEME